MTISPVVRRAFLILSLLLLPTAVYWNTISYRFGFRDDYSILREAHEEPGKIFRVCSAMARPIYGYLLEQTFGRLEGVDAFARMRLLTALLLGIVALLLFSVLRSQGWDEWIAAMLAAVVTMLPGAQVLVAWSIAWPPALALAFAVAAYGCAEKAFSGAAPAVRLGAWVLSLALIVGSTLNYQAACLFYLVPLAAGLLIRPESWGRETGPWLARHAVTFGCGLAVAATIMLRAYASGAIGISPRVALSPHIGQTLEWFFRFPLPNALALFSLDGVGTNPGPYYATVVFMTILLLAGIASIWRKHGWRHGLFAALITLSLPIAAHGAILISTERLATYRTLMPLRGLILVLAAATLARIAGRKVTLGMMGALTLATAWLAHRDPFDLIALPQSYELKLIEEGARQVNPSRPTKVFVITPALADAPSSVRVGDEFGSLATNSDWVPKEMFGVAVREIFGKTRVSYTFESGPKLPRDRQFDVVVDMRRLREFQATE
ncbi:MAG: glucosyltransferase domain-containing protein [Opitutaceae bacterium]